MATKHLATQTAAARQDLSGYTYQDAELNASHEYLLPELRSIVAGLNLPPERRRVFDVGCGNGSVGLELARMGFAVTGVDPSEEGIAYANAHHPELKLFKGSAYDDLAGTYGTFPLVVSLEVVEHVYFPRKYAQSIFNLLEPGGVAVISTPYHGYWKNLALALTGKLDQHFWALWDHGHIKFWSIKTLSFLLREQGFEVLDFRRVGRIAALAKSMIAVARKPAGK